MRRPGYVSVHEVAQARGWPSRAVLYQIIRVQGVQRYKFPADRRTYMRRAELARALRTTRGGAGAGRPMRAPPTRVLKGRGAVR